MSATTNKKTKADLTQTEREIVINVCGGHTNEEIGSLMNLSTRTVETYRLRLQKKLGITNLAVLTKWAIREGLTGVEV